MVRMLESIKVSYVRSLFALVFIAANVSGQTDYSRRVFFDNSRTTGAYFYSEGNASAPSRLTLIDKKLPIASDTFHTPPNALKLQWSSQPNGGWDVEVSLYQWRNRIVDFPGDTLTFWAYAPSGLKSAQMPQLALRDDLKNFTHPIPLQSLAKDVPSGEWVKIALPLAQFKTASALPFQSHRVSSVIFVQDATDSEEHTLIVDDIRLEPSRAPEAISRAVQQVAARGYERHVDVSWQPPPDESSISHYLISRADGSGKFQPVGIQVPGIRRYADYLGQINKKASYRVQAVGLDWRESPASNTAEAETHPMSDEDLLTMVQEASFRYYWEGAHPVSGMIRENLPGDDRVVATGATGFGVMALVVGADRGFATRDAVVERLLKMTAFLKKADRYHGVWPHFTDGATGKRMPVFGTFENGADLVETSFLLEGLLTALQYFKDDGPKGKQLEAAITDLWQSVEWDWFRRTADGDALFWHWSPEYTWHINHRLTGYNETMITYLLAIASPTHGVPADLYYSGWAGQSKAAIAYRQSWGQAAAGDHYTNGQNYEGIKLDVGVGEGGPLFFAHYSYMAFDPHVRDRFTNYFDNSRNQALINLAYSIRNPGQYKGYGPNTWGITAVDGPKGYGAFEPKPGEDKGVLAPTGAIASFPYTPEQSMAALKHFYRDLGDRTWGHFGFWDAFSLQQDWFSGIYMGLNQAPMTVMIENYRTGLLWKNFMANPEVQSMIQRVGFKREDAKQ